MNVRQLARPLGLGTVIFGLAPALFPRFFGRLFGIAASTEPSVSTAIRSVGIRDVVLGVGLLQAAGGGDDAALSQWLLARAACDTGDSLSVALGILGGERNPRFLALGGLALGAAVVGAVLQRRIAT